MSTTTLAISGMSCSHCVQAVTKALSTVPGVQTKSVKVGSAVIDAADPAAAIAAIGNAGFEAEIGKPATDGGGCSCCSH